jgi:hypothetical protein
MMSSAQDWRLPGPRPAGEIGDKRVEPARGGIAPPHGGRPDAAWRGGGALGAGLGEPCPLRPVLAGREPPAKGADGQRARRVWHDKLGDARDVGGGRGRYVMGVERLIPVDSNASYGDPA